MYAYMHIIMYMYMNYTYTLHTLTYVFICKNGSTRIITTLQLTVLLRVSPRLPLAWIARHFLFKGTLREGVALRELGNLSAFTAPILWHR